MTQAAFPPVIGAFDLARMRAEGRCVRAMSREAIVIRADLHAGEPRLWRTELLYAEWRDGPKAARVVGRTLDSQTFYVEIGTEAVTKGRALADAIEVPEQLAAPPRLRVKRTGRWLPWWAARVAWRKVDLVGGSGGKGE